MNALRWARCRVPAASVGDERGASLVLALAFLTLFGALVVALLGFVQAAFLAGGRVHRQGVAQYAMAGAIDVDIQRARKDPTMGVTTCNSLAYANVDVSCSAQPGDGGLRPGTDTPWNAILTLGGGITNNTANSTMAVAGPVYANGPISLTADSILDVEDLPVTGSACGSATANWKYAKPIVSCPPIVGDTSPPALAGADPNYASAQLPALSNNGVSTAKTLNDVTCVAGANPYYAYPKGYYNDVSVLTTTTCANAVARVFEPGVYYFDFPSTNSTWSINEPAVPIIGGTAEGWVPGTTKPPAAARPSDTNPVAACDRTQPGVQFVFGGPNSKVAVSAGSRMELCPYVPGQITMYGQRNTVVSSYDRIGTAATAQAVCSVSPTLATAPCWRNDGVDLATFDGSRVLTVNNVRAQAVVPEPNSGSAATLVTVTGFPGFSAPPEWGGFDVSITVAHGDGLVDPSNQSTIVGTNKADTAINVTVGTCASFDLLVKQGGFQNNNTQVVTQLSKSTWSTAEYTCIKDAMANPFSVTYQPVITKKGGAADAILVSALDGIKFTLTPIGALPQPQSTSGKFLLLAPGAKFASWGTVYMTNADFQVNANSDVIFDRGVILKSLIANGGQPNAPVFRLGGGRRTMLFEASTGGRRLKALVTVTDYNPAGYWARIKRWKFGP